MMGFLILIYLLIWQKQEKKQNQNQTEKIGLRTTNESWKMIEF
jgi:hypothetical protein